MRLNSDKIRSLMFRQGQTQTSVAKEAGISRTTITYVCNGKSCSSATAHAIATVLKVDLAELME